MTGEEIKKLILFNNKKIAELLDPSTFVFQPEVSKYLQANEDLRRQCSHEYHEGKCIYCGTPEN